MIKKIRLNGPSHTEVGSIAYQKECIFSLEPSIYKLISIAINAGWKREQVLLAIIHIAESEVSDHPTMFSPYTSQNDLQ